MNLHVLWQLCQCCVTVLGVTPGLLIWVMHASLYVLVASIATVIPMGHFM